MLHCRVGTLALIIILSAHIFTEYPTNCEISRYGLGSGMYTQRVYTDQFLRFSLGDFENG
jgi:hypothetical protein